MTWYVTTFSTGMINKNITVHFFNLNPFWESYRNWPFLFRMKHVITVITVTNKSIGVTQRGLTWVLRTGHSVTKLINLHIRELNNCILGGDFWVSCHVEICQVDRFSLEINFKRARSWNYAVPRLGSSLKKYTIWHVLESAHFQILKKKLKRLTHTTLDRRNTSNGKAIQQGICY